MPTISQETCLQTIFAPAEWNNKRAVSAGQCHLVKPYCHSEPVRTLAWESQSIALYTEIATPVTRSLVRNDTNLMALIGGHPFSGARNGSPVGNMLEGGA